MADESAPYDILSTAPQYVDICRYHNFPNFSTRYSIGLGGTVLTCSFSCVTYKKTTRLDWSTDLHAQSTLPEYVSFNHCQTSSRVLGVHPAETHLLPYRTTSSNSHSRIVSRILQYHWAVCLLGSREGPMTVLQKTNPNVEAEVDLMPMLAELWRIIQCPDKNTSLRIKIFRLPKEFCVHRAY